MNEELLSLAKAGKIAHVTRQAIYQAIKAGKLRATMINGLWKVRPQDLKEYRETKYDSSSKKKDGEYVFDLEKGHFSILHVAKVIAYHMKENGIKNSYTIDRIYYLLRSGRVKAFRKGYSWVISREDAIAFMNREMLYYSQ